MKMPKVKVKVRKRVVTEWRIGGRANHSGMHVPDLSWANASLRTMEWG